MSVEHQQLVLGVLHRIGGEVHVTECARHTRLSESEVTDALYELEKRGLATPTRWTQGPEPMPTLPLR